MDLFEQIDKEKKDLPKINQIAKKAIKYKYNAYQILAFILFFICFIIGIVLGNLFPVCGSSSSFYGDYCVTTEFNITLMIFVWLVGFLVSVIFFAIGHIIALLNNVYEKM